MVETIIVALIICFAIAVLARTAITSAVRPKGCACDDRSDCDTCSKTSSRASTLE